LLETTDGEGGDIMTASEIAVAEKLDQFLKEYADSQYCLEILRFFGKYPHARFNGLAVVHALNVNGGRSYIERALRHLIDKGVVKAYMENNVRLYSLTEDEPLSNLASDLAKLDWRQWQLVVKQIYPVPTE
jgi:hypothetical protein